MGRNAQMVRIGYLRSTIFCLSYILVLVQITRRRNGRLDREKVNGTIKLVGTRTVLLLLSKLQCDTQGCSTTIPCIGTRMLCS